MRKTFDQQLTLGVTPISKVKIPVNPRDHMSNLLAALQYIFVAPKWNQKIFKLLNEKIQGSKKKTGRQGMSLWEIFVLSQIRLCMNIGYDELHNLSNYHTLIRGVMGVERSDFKEGKQYSYQNIYDNIGLLEIELLEEINQIIVKVGHEVFKKKSLDLYLKVDSFVVETKTKFPTDYGILWDSIRNSIKIIEKLGLPKWRKSKSWKKELKSLMRSVGMISSRGGKNKKERLKKSAEAYLKKTIKLKLKIQETLELLTKKEETSKLVENLRYFYKMLLKHIDLVERRILKGETIPHKEKIISIFQPFVEMINKGKRNVEIGKKVSITTDENNLILDWRICTNESDSEIIVPTIKKLKQNHKIKILSVDKGYSSESNKEEISAYVEELIMPKKGKLTIPEKLKESRAIFIKYRKKHNAIESNINELEHRGLDKCPDRTEANFIRYVGLSCIAYNLHKIGQKMLRNTSKKLKKSLKQKRSA